MSSNRDGVAVPAGTAGQLGPVLGRAMRGLPDAILVALARGLREHRDELAPGRLFASPRSGGCAVGIALRELAPEAFDFGRLEYWLWYRRRRGIERDVAVSFPELLHLQRCFDKAVGETRDRLALDQRSAAREVGLWFAVAAERELSGRRPGPVRALDRALVGGR